MTSSSYRGSPISLQLVGLLPLFVIWNFTGLLVWLSSWWWDASLSSSSLLSWHELFEKAGTLLLGNPELLRPWEFEWRIPPGDPTDESAAHSLCWAWINQPSSNVDVCFCLNLHLYQRAKHYITCMSIRWALSLRLFCRICCLDRLVMSHCCSLLAIPITIAHGLSCDFLQGVAVALHKLYCTVVRAHCAAVVHFIMQISVVK